MTTKNTVPRLGTGGAATNRAGADSNLTSRAAPNETTADPRIDRAWIEPDETVAELAALARLRWDWLSYRGAQENLETRAWHRPRRATPRQPAGEAA